MYVSLFFKTLYTMKNLLIAFAVTLTLAGCGQTPMTDADMAAQYGLSIEEYQEQKEVAARMNMTIEDHLNMGDDSSSMNHIMPDGETMKNKEMDSHEKAAADMGMTLQEHIDAGHVGH